MTHLNHSSKSSTSFLIQNKWITCIFTLEYFKWFLEHFDLHNMFEIVGGRWRAKKKHGTKKGLASKLLKVNLYARLYIVLHSANRKASTWKLRNMHVVQTFSSINECYAYIWWYLLCEPEHSANACIFVCSLFVRSFVTFGTRGKKSFLINGPIRECTATRTTRIVMNDFIVASLCDN